MGLLYIVLAELFWATEIIIIRLFFPSLNSLFVSAISCVIASFFYIPTLFFIHEKLITKDWIMLVVLSFTTWFLGQIFYVKGVQKGTSAFFVSIATLSLPLFSILFGFLFLKESLSIKSLIGATVMVAGFIIMSL